MLPCMCSQRIIFFTHCLNNETSYMTSICAHSCSQRNAHRYSCQSKAWSLVLPTLSSMSQAWEVSRLEQSKVQQPQVLGTYPARLCVAMMKGHSLGPSRWLTSPMHSSIILMLSWQYVFYLQYSLLLTLRSLLCISPLLTFVCVQHAILAHLRYPPDGFEEPTVSWKLARLLAKYTCTLRICAVTIVDVCNHYFVR